MGDVVKGNDGDDERVRVNLGEGLGEMVVVVVVVGCIVLFTCGSAADAAVMGDSENLPKLMGVKRASLLQVQDFVVKHLRYLQITVLTKGNKPKGACHTRRSPILRLDTLGRNW